jgi:hypothetical protein
VIIYGTFYAPAGLRLHSIHLKVLFEESSGVLQLAPYVVLKQVSNPVELHDVPWFAFQPEFVKLNEEVAETKTGRVILVLWIDKRNKTANSMETFINLF